MNWLGGTFYLGNWLINWTAKSFTILSHYFYDTLQLFIILLSVIYLFTCCYFFTFHAFQVNSTNGYSPHIKRHNNIHRRCRCLVKVKNTFRLGWSTLVFYAVILWCICCFDILMFISQYIYLTEGENKMIIFWHLFLWRCFSRFLYSASYCTSTSTI